MRYKILGFGLAIHIILFSMPLMALGSPPPLEIKYAYWQVGRVKDGMEVYIHVAGTSPGAEYMDIRFYTKYDNGTEEWTPWLKGPFDYGHSKNNTTTVNALYFSPTADHWLAWEYLLDEIVPYNEAYTHIAEMKVEIRAFLDDGTVSLISSEMDTQAPEKEKDPRIEEPTYPEMNVHITEAKIVYRERGDFVDVDIHIVGRGSNASHVALNFIITYKNGTRIVSGWMGGPFNFGSGAKIGLNYSAYYFLSESGRWEEWEFRLNGTIDKHYAPAVYWYDDMASLKVYARAYLDNTEFLWNQDSADVEMIQERGSSPKQTPDALYVFIALVLIAILSVTAYSRTNRRKGRQ